MPRKYPNPVAKHGGRVNAPKVFRDKTKYRRKAKHARKET